MCHRMYDSKKCIGECHSCKTLCIMHLLSCYHITFVRCRKVIQNHLDCLQCKRICKWTVQGRYISFDRMCQCIHTCVSNLLYRETHDKIRIYNCNVRCNIKIGKWVFYSGLIVGNNGECCWRNCSKFCFCSQFREVERNTEIFKCNIRIFIECPHCFCSINRWSATHSYDPVRLELLHNCCTFHNGLNRWIWLNTFKKLYFHSCFFQIVLSSVEESLTLHGTSSDNQDCF